MNETGAEIYKLGRGLNSHLNDIVTASFGMLGEDMSEIIVATEDKNGSRELLDHVREAINQWIYKVLRHHAFLSNAQILDQEMLSLPNPIATYRLQMPDWIHEHPQFHEWLLAFANVAPETIRMHPAEFWFLHEQIKKKLEELGLAYLLPTSDQHPPPKEFTR